MTSPVTELLVRRVRAAGSEPLITYYDFRNGERTELSAVSFRNWVDKTANLMVDEYLLDPGDVVSLPVAFEAPAHWMTLVWTVACWQVGATAEVGESSDRPRLRVLGPTQVRARAAEELGADGVTDVLACSLHPLGLGFAEPLPGAVVDYAEEVRGQADSHAAGPVAAQAVAWRDATRTVTQGELAAVGAGPAGRRLVQTTDPWTAVRDGVLVPLVLTGSAVLVVGEDPERLRRIREQERVDD